MPYACVDSRNRDQQGWVKPEEKNLPLDEKLVESASEVCHKRGFEHFSLECPHNNAVEVWCLNDFQRRDMIAMNNCTGTPESEPKMNNGSNGHCTAGGTNPLGGWHRAAVYKVCGPGQFLNESSGTCENNPWGDYVSCIDAKRKGACPNGRDPNPMIANVCSLTCALP